MERALYEPALGYYAREPARVGRAGDFVTAASYPAFGRTLARLLPMAAATLGPAPARLRVVDAGAGEGGLLGALLSEARRSGGAGIEGVIVERGDALRA